MTCTLSSQSQPDFPANSSGATLISWRRIIPDGCGQNAHMYDLLRDLDDHTAFMFERRTTMTTLRAVSMATRILVR